MFKMRAKLVLKKNITPVIVAGKVNTKAVKHVKASKAMDVRGTEVE